MYDLTTDQLVKRLSDVDINHIYAVVTVKTQQFRRTVTAHTGRFIGRFMRYWFRPDVQDHPYIRVYSGKDCFIRFTFNTFGNFATLALGTHGTNVVSCISLKRWNWMDRCLNHLKFRRDNFRFVHGPKFWYKLVCRDAFDPRLMFTQPSSAIYSYAVDPKSKYGKHVVTYFEGGPEYYAHGYLLDAVLLMHAGQTPDEILFVREGESSNERPLKFEKARAVYTRVLSALALYPHTCLPMCIREIVVSFLIGHIVYKC